MLDFLLLLVITIGIASLFFVEMDRWIEEEEISRESEVLLLFVAPKQDKNERSGQKWQKENM